MKKNLNNAGLTLFLILLSISCTKSTNGLLEGTTLKAEETVGNLNSVDQIELLAACKTCQIKQFLMKGSWGPTGDDTMVFTYNRFGNPVTGHRTFIGTGSPNFVFRYDRFNRLTDFIGTYYDINNFDNVEFWNKYFYDRYGRIVKDSAYVFPSTDHGHPTPEVWHGGIVKYRYDAKNRISQTMEAFHDRGDTVITNYSYDGRGNLMEGGEYDNKINFRRTNKIWQFLDRNYSVNNSLLAVNYNSTAPITYKYNNFGLPIKILVANGGYDNFIFTGLNPLSFQHVDIKYTCDR